MNYFYVIIETKKESCNCFLSFINSVKKKRCRIFLLKYMWKTVLSSPVSELTGRLKNNSTFKHDIKINSVVKLSNFIRQEI